MKTEYTEATAIMTEAHQLLDEAGHGFLGMVSEGNPYVVPISFARVGDTIYLHGGRGRKERALRASPHVCFTVVDTPLLIQGQHGCNVDFVYRSAIITGQVRVVDDQAEKDHALTAFVAKYHSGQVAETLPAATVARTIVWAMDAERVTLKTKWAE